ncbi:MAG: tyrosine-type recombinase/integrase [Bacteroidales bacterium]|nr:tyrosine-type recombinase/integrase [Bacteroidales bacterium]
MNRSNFYLKDANAKNNTSIVLSFNYGGNRLRIATNKSINPDLWIKQKQRAKTNGYPENADLNEVLDEISAAFNSVYNEFVRNNLEPSKDQLINAYKKKLQKGSAVPIIAKKTFWDVFDEFVEYKRTRVSKDVFKDYNNSLRKHLLMVEPQLQRKLRFDDFKNVPNGFMEKLDFYLTYVALNAKKEKGLMVNTIGKQYKNLKVFFNYCFDKSIIEHFSIKHIVSITEETYKVFLSKEELDKILELDIESKELEQQRDLFILACFTGLRYGDLLALKPIHIHNDSINMKMEKTGVRIIVPLNPFAKHILNKYKNDIPKPKTSSDFNNAIREVTKLAKIDYKIEQVYKHGNTKRTEVLKKYEMVSSHTGRRSFCTNLFLAGMPTETIMVFSGHKTVHSFMRYLKIDSEIAAEKYRDKFFA